MYFGEGEDSEKIRVWDILKKGKIGMYICARMRDRLSKVILLDQTHLYTCRDSLHLRIVLQAETAQHPLLKGHSQVFLEVSLIPSHPIN
jgi:hypothetical protein